MKPCVLPTKEEIDPFNSIDGRDAVKHFYGKSIEDAEKLFGNTLSLNYTDDLRWMGPKGFCFYIQSAFLYAKNARSKGDSDFINGLYGALKYFVSQHLQDIKENLDLFINICNYIINNFTHFEINPNIYVNLFENYKKLLTALQAAKQTEFRK